MTWSTTERQTNQKKKKKQTKPPTKKQKCIYKNLQNTHPVTRAKRKNDGALKVKIVVIAHSAVKPSPKKK